MPRIVLTLIVLLFATLSFAEEFDTVSASLLRERLEMRCDISLDENTTFESLFAFLFEKFGIQALVDPKGAGALGITLSSPVVRESFRLRNTPIRQSLRYILAEQDLTYVNRDGILVITSEDEAKKYMSIRVYNVGDLVLPEKAVRDKGSVRFTADWDRADKADFSELMDLIEAVVSPDSWDEGGEMMEYYPGLSLVVRQVDEIHEEIEKLFDDLRQKRTTPYTADSVTDSTMQQPVVKKTSPTVRSIRRRAW